MKKKAKKKNALQEKILKTELARDFNLYEHRRLENPLTRHEAALKAFALHIKLIKLQKKLKKIKGSKKK